MRNTAATTASATSARGRMEALSTYSCGACAPPPRGPRPSMVTGIVAAKWLASLAPPRPAAMIDRPASALARSSTSPVVARASELAGRPIVGAGRGGASDASHFASSVPVTIDGLGPRGGGAHAPHEYVLRASMRPRCEVALAVVAAVLGMDGA